MCLGVTKGALTHDPQARSISDGEGPSSLVRPRLPDLLSVYDGPFNRIPFMNRYPDHYADRHYLPQR